MIMMPSVMRCHTLLQNQNGCYQEFDCTSTVSVLFLKMSSVDSNSAAASSGLANVTNASVSNTSLSAVGLASAEVVVASAAEAATHAAAAATSVAASAAAAASAFASDMLHKVPLIHIPQLPGGPLLHSFLVFAWFVYLLETYLDLRQYRLFKVKKKPAELTYVTQDEFEKAQHYGGDKCRFGFFTSLYAQLELTAFHLLGYYPATWALSAYVLDELFGKDANRSTIQITMMFYVIDAWIQTIFSLPQQLWSTFVIEARHGFNKQTIGLFFADQIKGLLLSCLIGGPLLALFVYVIEWGGEKFYIYVGALMLALQIVAIPVYANFIQPCFNKVEPLPEGSLRTSIEAMASKIHFPLTGLYVIDGSKRSSHSNAYFYGFFKSKRIVLFDTLINQCSESQVCAVLGHELGHWKCNHTIKNMMLSQLQTLAMFYAFGWMIHNPALYSDFGFHGSVRPTYIGLAFFMCVWSPISHVLGFIGNCLSRHFEFQADEFAQKLGYGTELQGGLITLQKENKGTMIPDPIYSAYHHSHPPLLERLRAVEEAMKSSETKKKQ